MADDNGIELHLEHSLYIRVCECKNLKIKDVLSRSSDPYVVLSGMGNGQRVRTKTVYKDLNPFYGEEFDFNIDGTMEKLSVAVWDENKNADALIGQVEIPARTFSHGRVHEQWYPLGAANTSSDDFVSGEVHCRVLYFPPDDVIPGKITITVVEAEGLASKDSNGLSDPYVKIRHAGRKFKTKIQKKTLNPFYDETFEIEIPPGSSQQLVISVWDWDRASANDFMGAVTLFLDDLPVGVAFSEWFALCSQIVERDADGEAEVTADDADEDMAQITGAKLGSVRLKLIYKEEEVLPLEHYTEFTDIVMGAGYPAIHALAEVTKERHDVAYHLVRIAEEQGYDAAVELLQGLVEHEVRATPDPNVIFRGNSMASKALDIYMQLVGLPYLHATLGAVVQQIYSMEEPCEVDPTRLDEDADLEANWSNLKRVVAGAWAAIQQSVSNIPSTFQVVFHHLSEIVQEQFPDDPVVRYTAVSGFLFLRLFCASILGPKLFSMMPDHPNATQSRVLTLVSKTLQNLANLAEFGGKEPFMHPMNEFIEAEIPNMRAFLEQVCTVSEDFVCANTVFIDAARERAALVQHYVRNRDALAAMAEDERNFAELAPLLACLDSLEGIRANAKRPEVTSHHVVGVVSDNVAGDGGAADGQLFPEDPQSMTQEERKSNMREVLRVQRQLSKCDVKKALASRDRIFIRQEVMHKVSKGKTQERVFFLFNNLLVYGEQKKADSVSFKGAIPMDRLVVVDPSTVEGMDANTQFRVINLKKKKHIDIMCTDAAMREAWMEDMSRISRKARAGQGLGEADQAIANKVCGGACVEYHASS